MSENPKGTEGQEPEDLKDYAGGWLTERKGTDAPGFLKLSFPVIGLGCIAYLFLQMYGDVNHETRGSLVREFNAATSTSPILVYAVGALALIYVIAVVVFALRSFHED